jgi:organic hydroperoxide reductase OsmC/OhrA
MQELPHHYIVHAATQAEGNVMRMAFRDWCRRPRLNLVALATSAPEHLLVASLADCFALTFRAIARASKLSWYSLEASAEGLLERVDRVTRFTEFTLAATLTVPAASDVEKARRLLEKAEATCLITNSLSATTQLKTEIVVAT